MKPITSKCKAGFVLRTVSNLHEGTHRCQIDGFHSPWLQIENTACVYVPAENQESNVDRALNATQIYAMMS